MYCAKEEEKIPLPPEEWELSEDAQKRRYAYFLALKGLIANEMALQGTDLQKAEHAGRYFQEALQYYDKSPVVYNGIANAQFFQLQETRGLSVKEIGMAWRCVKSYKAAANQGPHRMSYLLTNYTRARCFNNQACVMLDLLNKVFNYDIPIGNPQPRINLGGMPVDQRNFFQSFRHNKDLILKECWANIHEASKLCPNIAEIHITQAQFFSLYAEHLYRSRISGQEIIKLSKIVFGQAKVRDFDHALEKSLERVKTGLHLGFHALDVFVAGDESLRKYGFGAYLIDRDERGGRFLQRLQNLLN